MNEGNDPKLKMFTKLQNVPQITSKGEYVYNACITFYNLLLMDAQKTAVARPLIYQKE